jgi:aryl-alcohol dehydrogenase-like predicted oxidoreductase
MEYSKLGNSELKISRLGFGTMSLELENPLTPTMLQYALEAGINYFDTADMYQHGLNESLLGKTFRGKRAQVVLATKVGNQWRADGSGWDWMPSKKYILAEAEKSLQRLDTDYIDLYQLHGGSLEDPIDEIIEAFEMLKASGKIRYYGISSIRPNVIREYVKRSSIVSVMMQYSLLDRRPEEEMLHFLLDNRIAVLARGVIAKGLLVSKPPTAYLNYSAAEVGRVAELVQSFSNSPRSAFQTATGFVLDNPAISSAVIGIRTAEQLREATAVFDSPLLLADQVNRLKAELPVNKYAEHR